MEEPRHIQFQNAGLAFSSFDIVPMSKFYEVELDHSPEDLHIVEFYLLIFIESGSGQHTIDFTTYDYQPGSIISIRKDQLHKFHLNPEVKGKLLLFTDEFTVGYLEKLEALRSLQIFNELLTSPVIHLEGNVLERVHGQIERVWQEFHGIKDNQSLAIIRSELHILLSILFREKAKGQNVGLDKKYLNEFIAFQNLVEAEVLQNRSVQYFADALGKSSKTLNNITHSLVHQSAKSFIDGICMQQIKRMLINTNLNVKEVAYQCGFDETTNFYKYFKRHTSLTPEAFRLEH